jgi:hypothetical protein
MHRFTSCSLELDEARTFARVMDETNDTPIILEIQQGMIDRGADLAWLSQVLQHRHPFDGFAHHPLTHQLVGLQRPPPFCQRATTLPSLSQYPHEREILFPPLLALEILHDRKQESILFVTMRPSVNLSSMTIEAGIAKMQSSHVQLLDLLTDELRFIGVPRTSHGPRTRSLPRCLIRVARASNDGFWHCFL